MRFIISGIFALILAASPLAQSPSKVLKQAEKALGGAKALQSVRSMVKTGRIRRLNDGAEGRYLYQSTVPNLFNTSFDLNGFEIETAYNGRSGWYRNSREGLQTLTGKASIDMQARAWVKNNLWFNYKDAKSRITGAGQEVIQGKNANVVMLTTQKGAVFKFYFDPQSGLLLRDEAPAGEQAEVCDYSDYRDVAGLKHAFAQRCTLGDQTYEIALEDVKPGQPIPRSEFDFPPVSGAPLPEISTLLKEVQDNQDRIEAMLDHYSFTQKNISRELGKDGVLRETESETYQMSFHKGRRIARLIEKNGKPLSVKEQAEADKNTTKQVEEIEKTIAKEEARAAKQGSNQPREDENRRVSVAELLRASRLLNPRRERFRGRDVIVFDFEPNPAFDIKNAKSIIKLFGKMAGVMWIDEKDKQVARLEAVLFESYKIGGGVLAKLQKGASMTAEQERVNNEVWLPSQTDVNLSVRVLLIKGMNFNFVVKAYDYRRFETEVKDARIDDKKP